MVCAPCLLPLLMTGGGLGIGGYGQKIHNDQYVILGILLFVFGLLWWINSPKKSCKSCGEK